MNKIIGAVILCCLLYSHAWGVNQAVFTQSQITGVKVTYHASALQNGLIEIWTNENKYYAVSFPGTSIEHVSKMAHDIRECQSIVIRWEDAPASQQRRNVTDFWMSIR